MLVRTGLPFCSNKGQTLHSNNFISLVPYSGLFGDLEGGDAVLENSVVYLSGRI